MFTPPDKRAVLIIGTLVALGFAHFAVPSESAIAAPLELALFLGLVVGGATLAFLSLREGYCLNRPEITREDSPVFFWFEVAAASGLAIVGALNLWRAAVA